MEGVTPSAVPMNIPPVPARRNIVSHSRRTVLLLPLLLNGTPAAAQVETYLTLPADIRSMDLPDYDSSMAITTPNRITFNDPVRGGPGTSFGTRNLPGTLDL